MKRLTAGMLAALAISIFMIAPAQGNHGTEAGATLRAGWPVKTDDPATGGQLNQPIEGMSGHSGWVKHSSPTLANLDADPALEIVAGSLDGKVYVWNPDGSRMAGWPRRLDAYSTPTGPINGSPAVGDVDGDGKPEVIAGSDNGWVYVWHRDGTPAANWPQFTGFNGDYPSRCATNACTGVWAGPTIADLDGDGTSEIIVGSFSHKIWVFRGDGSVMYGWPRDVWDGVASSAAVADLDGDGASDIVIGSDLESDCANCPPYGTLRRGGLVHAFRLDGTEIPGWPVQTDSFQWSSPVIADLDKDGSPEVISGGGFFPSDSTSGTETRGHHVYVWDASGHLKWRHDTEGVVIGSVAVADMNGDGYPEVAVGTAGYSRPDGSVVNGQLSLLMYNGFRMWSTFGITPSASNGSGSYMGGPVLADVTGDGKPEVVASDADFHVKAYSINADLVMDKGTNYSMVNSPAVGDLDGDGKNEVVAASAEFISGSGSIIDRRGELWVFNTNGVGGLAWPQFQSRANKSAGFLAYGAGFHGGVRVAVGDMTSDPGDEIVTAPGPGGGPHVRVWSVASGTPTVVAQFFAYDVGFTGGVFVATANVDGLGKDEIITGAGAGGGPHVRVWSVGPSGINVVDQWFAYDISFSGGVRVGGGNVKNNDAAEEVITGPGSGGGPHVRVWDVASGSATIAAQWFAYDPGFLGGIFVGSADTAPGQGGDEVITGADMGGGPHVRTYSVDSATSAPTLRAGFFPYSVGFGGGVRVAGGQVDGVGGAEVITGAGPGGGPHVKCFPPALSPTVCSLFPFSPSISNGVYVAFGSIAGVNEVVSGLGAGGLPVVKLNLV
ncbi:MAG: VCBS repeat-containing protein [Actinobacteria bacterium]|nr:VCBS repeat-containing protein [Actinomycetota bacterium]